MNRLKSELYRRPRSGSASSFSSIQPTVSFSINLFITFSVLEAQNPCYSTAMCRHKSMQLAECTSILQDVVIVNKCNIYFSRNAYLYKADKELSDTFKWRQHLSVYKENSLVKLQIVELQRPLLQTGRLPLLHHRLCMLDRSVPTTCPLYRPLEHLVALLLASCCPYRCLGN